jgi:hypothetical protein
MPRLSAHTTLAAKGCELVQPFRLEDDVARPIFFMKTCNLASAPRPGKAPGTICRTEGDKYQIGRQSAYSAY